MTEPLKTSLCYLEHDGAYLMLLRNKKANDMNEGKWLGVGGKFQPGESSDACAVREVREETGYALDSLKFRGIVHFKNDIYPDEDMYLFTADVGLPEEGALFENAASTCLAAQGDGVGVSGGLPECALPWPVPICGEGTFAWIPKEKVPKLPLWEGDRVFLQMLADGVETMEITLSYHGDALVDVRIC